MFDFDLPIERKGTDCSKYDDLLLKYGTEDVIPMWIADMDFATVPEVTEAIISRAKNKIFGYAKRNDSAIDAMIEWQKRRNNLNIDKKLLSWAHGVVVSLSTCVKLFANKKNSVIIMPPVYPQFFNVIKQWDKKLIECPLILKDGKYTIDKEKFKKLSKDADLFIHCNPHNPIGRVWSLEEQEFLVDTCYQNGVKIISDEIHMDLVYKDVKHFSMASVSEKAKEITATCISGSKTFNIAGIQSSFIVFPNEIMKKQFDDFWAKFAIYRGNAFESCVLENAYKHGEKWADELIEYIEKNAEFVDEYIKNNIPKIKSFKPEATYLMWLDLSELGLSSDELLKFFIKDAKIAPSPGISFSKDYDKFMRINIAMPKIKIEQAMEQLKTAIDNLK